VETRFRELIRTLSQARVEFIVVGGVAAFGHGSARFTLDLDVVYRRTDENISRLVSALAPLKPYLRGAPPGLPFSWSEEKIKKGLNFTLNTSLGAIDLLGEITGGGIYEDVLMHSITLNLHGTDCFCLNLESLIKVKRAAGRPKDFEAIAELEAILEERKKLEDEYAGTHPS
jgi:predicted nucleotidyltransferase